MALKELKEPIYLRQEGESEEAFRAFEMYRDTPINLGRSYASVAESSRLTSNSIMTYGSIFRWKERALAFDRYQDGSRLEQINRRRVEMQDRHSKIGAAMLAKVTERLNSLDGNTLTARDIKEWVDIATKVENLARGQATSITRTVISTQEQDRLTKEQLIKEAKEFINETRIDMPEIPMQQLFAICKKEFDVEPEEIGYFPADAGEVMEVGNIG